MNNRAVIYCRVSGREQVEEGNSLVTQERICREYALTSGIEVVEAFIEKGESAKDRNRTELKRLPAFCTNKKNQVGIVITYKIDRIARRKYDYDHIKIQLKRYGVEIKSCTENFDDSPSGRFMESVIADVAQFDNDMRTERSVGGMRQAMQEGRYVWIAPLGYDNIRINGKGTIAKNKIAAFILSAFELVSQNNASIEEIRKQMLKNGLTNNSGKLLSRAQFYRILKNQVYAGWIIKFGERHKGIFDPIVNQELFDQVQRVLKHRQRRNFSYLLQNPDFPLRRFVRHPSGIKLTGSWSRGRTNYYAYYRFKIMGFEFRKEGLEMQFMEFIDSFQFDKTEIKGLSSFLRRRLINATKSQQTETLQMQKQVMVAKERQKMLLQKNMEGVISNELLREHLDLIEVELMNANAILARIPKRESNIEELLKFSFHFLEKPSLVWSAANLEGKLKLQRFHFPQGVVFDGKKFGTAEIPSIFKAKSFFLANLSHGAGTMHNTSNHQVASKSPHKWSFRPPKDSIQPINEAIVELGKIIQEVRKAPPDDPELLAWHPAHQGRYQRGSLLGSSVQPASQ